MRNVSVDDRMRGVSWWRGVHRHGYRDRHQPGFRCIREHSTLTAAADEARSPVWQPLGMVAKWAADLTSDDRGRGVPGTRYECGELRFAAAGVDVACRASVGVAGLGVEHRSQLDVAVVAEETFTGRLRTS